MIVEYSQFLGVRNEKRRENTLGLSGVGGVCKHLFLNTLGIAALQNNEQTNQLPTNRRNKFSYMHTLITSISPVLSFIGA